MPQAYERLQREWCFEEARTAALDEHQITKLEDKYDLRIPEEFREYLRHACPANDYCGDEKFIDWWSLDRLKNIVDEYEHRIDNPLIARLAGRSLFFADYAIWCWAWAIVCEPGDDYGRVLVIGGSPADKIIADSFGHFVDLYMQDHNLLI